ncbi:MAG: hypothetical protein ABIG95_02085 [Candidatus Woesearchaeota archaeon]
MGLRAIIRDVLLLYLGFKLLITWLTNQTISNHSAFLLIIVLILTLWFFFERFGIVPKVI